MDKLHTCYVLINKSRTRTYVGYTNNKMRRIRQHNREIRGGAYATANDEWEYLFYIESEDFTKHLALSFEWHMKEHRNIHHKRHKNIIANRISLLKKVLAHWKFIDMKIKCYYNSDIFDVHYNNSGNFPENIDFIEM